jgi:hypothetical protein
MTDNPAPTAATPTVPPMPATAPTAPRTQTRRRTLTTALIGTLVGAAAVGAAWFITADSHPDRAGNSSHGATATGISEDYQGTQPGTFVLAGDFTLTDNPINLDSGGCEGGLGYDDIATGTAVTVYDAAGSVVGTGSLLLSTFMASDRSCIFQVAVDNIPADEDFYQVEIAHRGRLQLSAAEAQSGGFHGSLGD